MVRSLGACVLLVILLAGCAAPAGSTAVNTSPDSAAPSRSPSPTLPAPTLSTPQPSPASPASSVSPWTSSADTLAWHRLGIIPGSRIDGVVGFEIGYVVLQGNAGAVWHSLDGRSWRQVDLPADFPLVPDANGMLGRAIATNGDEVLVVGGYSDPECQPTPPGSTGEVSTGDGPECPVLPIAWISGDGVTWRTAYPEVADSGEFVAAWPVAAGGWIAALSDWYGECLGGDTIWRSADGISWKRVARKPPAAWEGYEHAPLGVASGSGDYLLAASERGDDRTTLGTTTAGEPWTVLDGFPGEGAEVVAGAAPLEGRTRWVLAGASGCDVDEGCGGGPTIWSSADGVDWTATVLPVGPGVAAAEPGDPPVQVAAVTSLVLSDRGFVAVGAEASWSEGARHETWVSEDGVSWEQLPGTGRPRFDYGPGLVADGPAGVIGISGSEAEDESVVWQLR